MPKKRETNEAGEVKCARCGLFKNPDDFNRGDSYDRECRKAYASEYHATRKLTDNKYLPIKAARAKRAYHNDEMARARRLESAAKYRSRLRNEDKARAEGKPPPSRPEPVASPRVQRQVVEKKWSDL